MGRLIDADALIPQMESDANQMEDPIAIMFAYAAISDIKHAPTVEAIPIEWIRKYTEENRLYQSDDFDIYINDMIADWAERK